MKLWIHIEKYCIQAGELILYGCIFISLCAVSMSMETSLLLHLPLNHFFFYLFIFSATLFQYNVHYYVKTTANQRSARFAWSLAHKRMHLFFIVMGVAGMLISLNFLTLKHYLALLCIGMISAMYSLPVLPFRKRKRIKDFGLLKIITLSLVWTLVTVWFPVIHLHDIDKAFWLVFFRRMIFLFVLCLAFDIRDVPVDARDGIHTLPVSIGVKNAYLLIDLLLIIFVALSVWNMFEMPEPMPLAAMIISALATYWTIDYARRHRHDMVYLLGVDGMMMLQTLLVALSIWFTRISA
ncbi:UbiA family prenyltransferase [Thermoflavifilum thermophilum]|uniref:UbiA prenyltransferase family protein n=1 Tax=Thermoflavifilum thermophilum TaxID=1393122 RepID=A0A1I7NMJ5_9BACT|nr:UbiA family prenyltransferase [Thermoflavifilum thermophilum]SFV35835.1 UbiA prenyltransferase family protein [Thermoflavifilum thermophilum]